MGESLKNKHHLNQVKIGLSAESKAANEKRNSIDMKQLDSIRSIQSPEMPDILKKVVEIYLETSKDTLDLIEASLNAKNANALAESLHNLKSSSANLGATEVAKLCKILESHGNKNLSKTLAILEKLKVEHRQSCSELKLIMAG